MKSLLANPRPPLPDRVTDDIGPQETLVPAIPDRTFAEIEPVRDGIEPRIGSDDPCQAGCREIDVQQFPPVTDG